MRHEEPPSRLLPEVASGADHGGDPPGAGDRLQRIRAEQHEIGVSPHPH